MPETTTYAPTKGTDPILPPKPGPTYVSKPPSAPTYTGKPPSGPTYDAKPPSGPNYDAKPPTDSTYTPTPHNGTTYDAKPPAGPTYDAKPPSGPTYTPTPPPDTTYDAKPPSGPTYEAKPPSGPTYDGKPPSGPPYSPHGPKYDAKPPSTYSPTYNPTPSYGSGYAPKDCSCGTEIPEECTCTPAINIKGRIREHIKNCSYEFVLPCNHVAVMYGVRTAIYEQIVNVSIRRKSERRPYKEWSFEGQKDSMLLNLEGSSDVYNLNILPEGIDRIVVVTFQSYSNSEYMSSDMRYKEIIISSDKSPQCSYFYTFFVEAGDDCDYHDTDFCVSVLPSKK